MKIAIGIMSILFAIYLAIESYLIASLGTSYQIPQLEGDGGGGLIAAAMILISGILVFGKPLWAAIGFALSMILVALVGAVYQDNLTLFLAIAPALFVGLCIFTMSHARKQAHVVKASHRRTKLHVPVKQLL